MIRVLVVDDDPMVLRAVTRTLRAGGLEATATANAEEALAKAREAAFDVVVSDLEMPIMHGDALCRAWRGVTPIPFILLSGSPSVFERALACGARVAFLKPVDPKTLVAAVRDAAETGAR